MNQVFSYFVVNEERIKGRKGELLPVGELGKLQLIRPKIRRDAQRKMWSWMETIMGNLPMASEASQKKSH